MHNFLDDLKNLYSKAGNIHIFDPHALEIGIRPGHHIVVLSLLDIGKLTGHVCPAVTSAYFIIKLALKHLSPDEIPSRENFLVAVPKYDDMALVYSIVLDAFPAAKDDPDATPKMFFDRSLAGDKENVKFIFKNISNGKTVCVTWKKSIAMPPEVREKMMFYKQNPHRKTRDHTNYLEWNTFVNQQVERIIKISNVEMLEIEEVEYNFPGQMNFNLI